MSVREAGCGSPDKLAKSKTHELIEGLVYIHASHCVWLLG